MSLSEIQISRKASIISIVVIVALAGTIFWFSGGGPRNTNPPKEVIKAEYHRMGQQLMKDRPVQKIELSLKYDIRS